MQKAKEERKKREAEDYHLAAKELEELERIEKEEVRTILLFMILRLTVNVFYC